MLDFLRAHDSNLVELTCGRGSILVPPSLNGRIFCQLDGELIHRLDFSALRNPSPTEYNNLGGNSLWPAPEGGPYAFNYPLGSDRWCVQDGICRDVPTVLREGADCVLIEKRISLANRKGAQLDLDYRRIIWAQDGASMTDGFKLHGMCYYVADIFDPRAEYNTDDVLLAPWSLEQFPGADDIVAFGRIAVAQDAINRDFYGDPGDRISCGLDFFTFRLGGQDRSQIGIKVASSPRCIGAIDLKRSLLIVRKTQVQDGVYFNIADNDQPAGPFSSADAYSIFNGGDLGFFELETIGSMRSSGGHLSVGILPSQTLILKGPQAELLRYLAEEEGLHLKSDDICG